MPFAILVGVGSFITPYSESLTWSAISLPLASVLTLECHNGLWALKSPIIILFVLSSRWLMLVMEPLGQDEVGGMYTFTNLISVLPEMIVMASCSIGGVSVGGEGSVDVEY